VENTFTTEFSTASEVALPGEVLLVPLGESAAISAGDDSAVSKKLQSKARERTAKSMAFKGNVSAVRTPE
jgi:hypothetical protein